VRFVSALLVLFLAISCQHAVTPATQPVLEHSHDQCRAVVVAALRAGRHYVDTVGNGIIPREDWGDVIVKLNPIRVEEEVEPNIIVYIVLSEDGTGEEGLCVCQTDTSGGAAEPVAVKLEMLCNDGDQEGILYRYRRAK